jgi:hypothetical protein
MKKNNGFACFAVAGFFLLASLPGQAASGTVDIILSAVSHAYPVQMGDTTVTASGGSGTLTFVRSSGRPFVEGSSAPVLFASFSKDTPSGLELEADGVATFSPDDTLLLLFERRSDSPGAAGEGNLRLMGGTGRFAGVDGQCKYKADNQPQAWNLVASCQWLFSFPYR